MTYEEAIKEAEIQFDVYENMILYNKDFEPKNDNSNYERKIEFLKMAIKALEKQIPKKPVNYDSVPHSRCPVCNNSVKVFEDAHEYHYCLYCGQALDWDNKDEEQIEEVVEVESEDTEEETLETATQTTESVTKVNKDRYNALRWAVEYAMRDMNVELCENGTSFGEGVMRWDANWTQAEAAKLAEDLKMAEGVAEALNEMNLELVCEDDEALNALIAEDREEASRRFTNFKMMLVDKLHEIYGITTLDPESYDRLLLLKSIQIQFELLMTDYPI